LKSDKEKGKPDKSDLNLPSSCRNIKTGRKELHKTLKTKSAVKTVSFLTGRVEG
jgi:hypothetical protein